MRAAYLVLFVFIIAVGMVAQDASWEAPATAAAQKNPLADDANAASRGQKLYADRCAGCHGANGVPSLKTATNFQQPVKDSDGAMFWKITAGKSKLSPG